MLGLTSCTCTCMHNKRMLFLQVARERHGINRDRVQYQLVKFVEINRNFVAKSRTLQSISGNKVDIHVHQSNHKVAFNKVD